MSAGAGAKKPAEKHICITPDCGKPAAMQCPVCRNMKLPASHFCDQECFKGYWKVHKQTHELAKNMAAFKPFAFPYTGPLRPAFVTPRSIVPASLKKPDWWKTGIPVYEREHKGDPIAVHSKEAIEKIRKVCRLGREVLDIAHRAVRPGITTDEIDKIVHAACMERNCYPSPLNYHHFPKSCCTSVNEVICHGIPDMRPLEEGDIVNVDISVFHDGYHGDLNETFCVGVVEQKYKDLIKATHDSLMAAIQHVKPGSMCRDFGKIISKFLSKGGYSVVRSYCGHGIGEMFHCAPNIPHYNRNKATGTLRPGMVFTIEPMVNMGSWQDKTWPDDWTSVTVDGKRSAQFEHQVVVTEDGCEILTKRLESSPPLWWEQDGEKAGADEPSESAKK